MFRRERYRRANIANGMEETDKLRIAYVSVTNTWYHVRSVTTGV